MNKWMTVSRMHKILGILIKEGQGRRRVSVNKDSFSDPREEDGIVILPVVDIKLKSYPMGDDDGGTKINSDGTERIQIGVVISGDGE